MPMTEADAALWRIRFLSYPIADLIEVFNRGGDTGALAKAELHRRLDADGVPRLADREAWERFAPTSNPGALARARQPRE